MTRKGFFLFLIIIIITIFHCSASSVKLSVSAGRGSRDISVGSLFYIIYEVTDTDAKPEQPVSVPGAKVMYFERTGQSSRFSSVNGKTSQSFSYTYTLTLKATEEGKFTFGPISVGNDKSNVVSYNIVTVSSSNVPNMPNGGNVAPAGNGNNPDKPKYIGKGDGNLFLRADVSHSTAFQQEALVYTVKLYTTYDAIKFIGATAAPKFDGFVVEESKDISTSLEYETYNGKTYATAVIARYIIFPQSEGQLKVTGNTYTVSVDEREYYHDPFWGNLSVAKPLQLNVTPNDLTVNVKPLPKPIPADFSGGVGEFRITSELPSQNFSSNHAGSIIYTIKGTGNIKYITLPDLNNLFPPQLEVYSPNSNIDTNVGRTNVTGTAKFDYSFIPLEAGHFLIPEVRLTYFNPQTGKYETSVAKGYNITVASGSGSEKSQTRSNLSFNADLLDSNAKIYKMPHPYIDTFGYWLFYIIPLLLFIGIGFYYRSYLKRNSDLLVVKSRKASKIAKSRLKKAEACISRHDSRQFYDEILSALWGYVSDKLKIPGSELNRENISTELLSHSISAEETDKLISLLDDCEFAKYSPSGNAENLETIYDNAAMLINSLEESFRKQK